MGDWGRESMLGMSIRNLSRDVRQTGVHLCVEFKEVRFRHRHLMSGIKIRGLDKLT